MDIDMDYVTTMFDGGASADIYQVVDAYEHAILGKYPKSRYLVGGEARYIAGPLSYMPQYLQVMNLQFLFYDCWYSIQYTSFIADDNISRYWKANGNYCPGAPKLHWKITLIIMQRGSSRNGGSYYSYMKSEMVSTRPHRNHIAESISQIHWPTVDIIRLF